MTLKFDVSGMTCAACSARVEKVVAAVADVQKVEVNLLAGRMSVEVGSESTAQIIIDAVHSAGYGASLQGSAKKKDSDFDRTQKQLLHRVLLSGIFLIILMYFTMGHMLGLPLPTWYCGPENALVAALLQFLLTLPPVILNSVYYTRGLKALFKGAPNMDSLIAVGSGAALTYGIAALFRMAWAMGAGDLEIVAFYMDNLYFESAAMILTLITLGKFLEAHAKGRTGDSIRQLMDLSPKTATVRNGEQTAEIPVEDVRIGDVVLLRSGGRVPVDGTVIAGRASVDYSPLTGESIPVEVDVGDSVPAAAIVTDGYLELRAEKVGQDTTLAQIIRLVEEAGGSKAPIARLADKVAGIFVPAVMLIALAAFGVWLLAGQDLEFALTTGISVLVISCPCALGLATPVAIMVGTGRAARLGVLFKNAESLENLHRTDTVVLDKTGTLTVGKPEVTDVLPVCGDAAELFHIAASLECRSEHPFAKAIMDANGSRAYTEPSEFETLPGMGVCGIINKIKYYGGNRRLMESVGISVPEYPDMTKQGRTPLYFASEQTGFLGCIVASDVLKKDSCAAVARLKALGMKVIMLTGDNAATAHAIAAEAGIDHVIPEVLPTDKANVIKDIRSNSSRVLMVGDGINDAPALVTADVGIAIGAGTDIAIESADVVLMKDSIADICCAIELSKATIRNIRQNLFWAFFYNCLGIPIAAGALYPLFGLQLSPMIGAAAMSMSSVFVVSNALRLRLFKPKELITTELKQSFQQEEVMNTVIYVEGMMCPHCKARVESVCNAVPGAVNAVVDLQEKSVTVEGNASVDALKKAIVDAGYQVIE